MVRYAREVGPADVGARVTVRRVLTREPLRYGDVVGDLVSWSPDTLVVRTRRGNEVRVEQDTVVATRKVPPAPVRRRAGA